VTKQFVLSLAEYNSNNFTAELIEQQIIWQQAWIQNCRFWLADIELELIRI